MRRHFENKFQLDRCTEGKARDAKHQPARVLVFSKDVLQQLGSAVSDFGLVAEVSRGCNRNAEPDDASNFVERSQMLARDSEAVERRKMGCFASGFHIEFRADAPDEFPRAAFGGQHSGEEKQIAGLHRFRIRAERLRRRRELNTKFRQRYRSRAAPRSSAA